MIGLERVLHAQQKPKPQNAKHGLPALSAPPIADRRSYLNRFKRQ
jgi:hypothetical protein